MMTGTLCALTASMLAISPATKKLGNLMNFDKQLLRSVNSKATHKIKCAFCFLVGSRYELSFFSVLNEMLFRNFGFWY